MPKDDSLPKGFPLFDILSNKDYRGASRYTLDSAYAFNLARLSTLFFSAFLSRNLPSVSSRNLLIVSRSDLRERCHFSVAGKVLTEWCETFISKTESGKIDFPQLRENSFVGSISVNSVVEFTFYCIDQSKSERLFCFLHQIYTSYNFL